MKKSKNSLKPHNMKYLHIFIPKPYWDIPPIAIEAENVEQAKARLKGELEYQIDDEDMAITNIWLKKNIETHLIIGPLKEIPPITHRDFSTETQKQIPIKP